MRFFALAHYGLFGPRSPGWNVSTPALTAASMDCGWSRRTRARVPRPAARWQVAASVARRQVPAVIDGTPPPKVRFAPDSSLEEIRFEPSRSRPAARSRLDG